MRADARMHGQGEREVSRAHGRSHTHTGTVDRFAYLKTSKTTCVNSVTVQPMSLLFYLLAGHQHHDSNSIARTRLFSSYSSGNQRLLVEPTFLSCSLLSRSVLPYYLP